MPEILPSLISEKLQNKTKKCQNYLYNNTPCSFATFSSSGSPLQATQVKGKRYSSAQKKTTIALFTHTHTKDK